MRFRSQPAGQLHVSLCEVDRDPTCGNCDVDRVHHGSGPQCACRCVGDGQWALVRSAIANFLKAIIRHPLGAFFLIGWCVWMRFAVQGRWAFRPVWSFEK